MSDVNNVTESVCNVKIEKFKVTITPSRLLLKFTMFSYNKYITDFTRTKRTYTGIIETKMFRFYFT